MQQRANCKMHKVQGVSLIETMIALTLLSIGIFGQVRSQLESVSTNHSSYYRLQAAYLANEIVGRMRLNPAGVDAGYYDSVSTTTTYENHSCRSSSGGCTVQQVAAIDLYDWTTSATDFIPGGEATVTRDTNFTDQAVFNINISWTRNYKGLSESDSAKYNKFSMQVGI